MPAPDAATSPTPGTAGSTGSTGSTGTAGTAGTTGRSSRSDLLDGLRGVAIVLVVLSHSWHLVPAAFFDENWYARPVIRAGNSAVTIFLVASGYLTYRALARNGSLREMQPGLTFVRRVIRVAPSLWLLLAAVMLMSWLDPTDTTRAQDNIASVKHVVTYTWNWYAHDYLLLARGDLGHLWYLSVDMQAFVIMAAFLYMLRRRPLGVVFALAGFWLLLVWWRFHLSTTEMPLTALLRTTVRMDAFVIGVLAAAMVPLLTRFAREQATFRFLALTSALAIVPLLYWTAADFTDDGDAQYLRWGGTVLQLDVALLLCCAGVIAATRGRLPRALAPLSSRPLVALGRHSLLPYIWHLPVFVFVERHGADLSWPVRGAVALLATAVLCLLSHWLVERHVVRFLRLPWWNRFDAAKPTAN